MADPRRDAERFGRDEAPRPWASSVVGGRPSWRSATAAIGRLAGLRGDLLVVLALSGFGLWLRATGAGHGLPNVYHPDVPKQLDELARFLDGLWVPADSIYPVLHMYVAAWLLEAQGLTTSQALESARSQAVVTVRLLSAVLATGVIPLAYLTGRWLAGRPAGLWAAALTALSALHVVHAHYAMGDATHVFFVAASLAAAARALVTGGTGAIVLGAVLAGLAAASKLYGGAVGVALAVAVLAGPRRPPRRALALVALAGLLAVAAFALATPKFLDDPGGFLHQLRHGTDFGRPTLPPWGERPAVVAGTLGVLVLDWLGPGVATLAAIGALAMLWARRAAAALLLAPLAVLYLVYVAARPSYLDDRNLLPLSGFAYLLAGAALALAGVGSSRRAAVAAIVGLALVGAASVDAVTAAHLFREEDTRTAALRWEERLGPDTRLAEQRYYESRESARSEGADVLRLMDYDYWRPLYRYGTDRLERAGRSLAFFEAQGKLLKRFELLPRGFTAPTLAYFDLASMDVPYAFPRPDDVARPEPLVYVDAAAVPERASAVAPRARAVTQTVVSREPLRRLGVALSGAGRARVRHGGLRAKIALEPGALHVELFTPRRAFPWYKHFYPVTVEAPDGWVAARLLVTPCDVAWAHLAYEEFSAALPHLADCQGTPWVEPARLLDLAWASARLGQPEAARQALADLEAAAPGLLAALADLAGQPDGPAWRERYARLAGHGPWLWHDHTHAFRMGQSGTAHDLGSGAWTARLGTSPDSAPSTLKVWFERDFLRGPFQVRFRLRGGTPDGSPVARLDVVRHRQRQAVDVPVSREWTGTGPGTPSEEITLPVTVEHEPAGLEARVHFLGTGWLEVEEIAVVPDVRASLRAKLETLEPLLEAPRPGGS